MTFLHGEFFYWMLPPIVVLFYFWQTQKSPHSAPFSEAVLERLHAPATTMGLRGRNALFLAASVLLIVAMAQPVIMQNEAAMDGKVDILIALNLSKKSLNAFNAEKMSAVDILRQLRGENISLVGYDTKLYRIAPYTRDTDMLVGLIEGLASDAMQTVQNDSSAVRKLKTDEGITIIIGDPIYERNTHLSRVLDEIEGVKKSQRHYAHIPLFYYPLGLAMFLIWIALSSMSKRRSVSIAAVLVMLKMSDLPANAGILDFQTLKYGYEAYRQGDYRQSAGYFKMYQKEHDSPEIRYNLANAFCKAGEYEKALYWYRQVYTTDHLLRERERKRHDDRQEKRLKEGVKIEIFSEKTKLKSPSKENNETKTRLYPM